MLKPLKPQEITVSKRKKKAMLQDKAFLDQVTERVYQLMLADLRREQERRGG
jgi:hypothetical protein